jgi:hypothetical protein
MGNPAAPLASEDRQGRITELTGRVGKEWRRYAIVEFLFVMVPAFGIFVVLIERETSGEVLFAAAVVLTVPIVGLAWYWVRRRIRPLEEELNELRRLEGR